MNTLEFWLQFIGVAALVALSDVVWTLYFIATADRKAVQSAGWSALTVLIGAFVTVSYLHDLKLLLGAALGAFAGTYYTIRWTNNSAEVRAEKKERDI